MHNRKVIVELSTPAGDKRLDGINVNFSVTKLASAIMNKATIDICNLTKADIDFLTTYTSEFIAINQHKRIRLWAGYEDTGIAVIFDGDIVEALPSDPPDIWLKCQALSGYYNAKDPISKTFNGNLSFKAICQEAAKILNLTLDYESSVVKNITDFSFNGGKTKILNALNELADIDAYEDDGILVVKDAGEPRKSAIVRYINENSGMIGMPKPDALGVTLNVLLDNSLKIGQKIYLESRSIPSCSGEYYIYELKHDGSLRGNNFYTQIKARRLGNVFS